LRATRAYITSFGTTGLLIASALLTLAVMSAFVAFNGFPGQSVQDPIGTLLLQEPQAQVSVPVKPVHVNVLATRRGSRAAARHREGVRNSRAPKASTGPVAHRTPTQTPTRTQAPQAPASSQGTVPVTETTPPIVPGTEPTLPDTGLPALPGVTVPTVPPPPPPSGGSQQLPIDTSGVTSILGGG
jgi:hypothetical protein